MAQSYGEENKDRDFPKELGKTHSISLRIGLAGLLKINFPRSGRAATGVDYD